MTIVPVNDVWIRIDCADHIAHELSDYFSYEIPGAKFMPAFRKRHWTGKIHLFKLRGHLIYRGLLPRVLEFAQQRSYPATNNIPHSPRRPPLTSSKRLKFDSSTMIGDMGPHVQFGATLLFCFL